MLKFLFYLDPIFELSHPFNMHAGWLKWYELINKQLQLTSTDYDSRIVAFDAIQFVEEKSFMDKVITLSQAELRDNWTKPGNVYHTTERNENNLYELGDLIIRPSCSHGGFFRFAVYGFS